MATATTDKYGTRWATSRDGELSIALRPVASPAGTRYEVTALYAGTHDLAPVTQAFVDEGDARDYANWLWKGKHGGPRPMPRARRRS